MICTAAPCSSRFKATLLPWPTSKDNAPVSFIRMISKCANPGCSKLLMRMDGGRFFGFHTSAKSIEHFWLCVNCSRHFTLKLKQGKVELESRQKKTA